MDPPRPFDPARWCARLADSDDFPRVVTTSVLNKVPQKDVNGIQEKRDNYMGLMGKRKAGSGGTTVLSITTHARDNEVVPYE